MIGRAPLLVVLGGVHSGGDEYVHARLRRLLVHASVVHVAADTHGDVAPALADRRGIAVVLDDFASALRAAGPADSERAEAYAIEVAETLRAAAGMVAVIASTEPTGDPSTFGEHLGAANRALAAAAEEVVLVVAGLGVTLKGGED